MELIDVISSYQAIKGSISTVPFKHLNIHLGNNEEDIVVISA